MLRKTSSGKKLTTVPSKLTSCEPCSYGNRAHYLALVFLEYLCVDTFWLESRPPNTGKRPIKHLHLQVFLLTVSLQAGCIWQGKPISPDIPDIVEVRALFVAKSDENNPGGLIQFELVDSAIIAEFFSVLDRHVADWESHSGTPPNDAIYIKVIFLDGSSPLSFWLWEDAIVCRNIPGQGTSPRRYLRLDEGEIAHIHRLLARGHAVQSD